MGKVIGVLNQKGGVGKSLLTILLATNIHIERNKNKDKDFVAIFDGDYPQHSILDVRKTERDILTKKVNNENDYYLRRYKNIYFDGFEPLNIYQGSINELYNDFDRLREKHEYSFVDVVGTVNVEGYDDKFLSNFDFIIVPTNLHFKNLKSSLNFVKNFVHPLYQLKKLNYALLLNNVDGRSKNATENSHEEIKSTNYPILDTIFYRDKKYLNLYLDNEPGSLLSTIYNKSNKTIDKLINEVLSKI